MAMLELQNVNKSFGGLKAITDVNLSVNEGEIVSIIGPNGAGKSTLFNLITGVYDVDDGNILFEERAIVGRSPAAIVDLGIARTFQNLRLFNQLSVFDNVLIAQHHNLRATPFGAVFRTPRYREQERLMRERALEKLGFFGNRLLGYRLHQPVYVLTYANRRRTEMARAMATGAKLLLLDEPSAGMDPQETREMIDIILRMRDEGYTVLLVEHKMHLVGKISDRVAVLDYGKKIAEGSYREVATNPAVIEAYLGAEAAKEGRTVASSSDAAESGGLL